MRYILTTIALFIYLQGQAQELNCRVVINTPKLQTVDPKVFRTLETAINNYLNNSRWTEDQFETEEKINCNFTLNITEELSAISFKADLAIQATRPVYGTDYETVIFSHSDNEVAFTYEEFQPLEYSENVFTDNLSAVLAFYSYVILGIDYDTFAENGGEAAFQKAQNIVSTIPSNIADAFPGWKSIESQRNRYWMIENFLSPRMINFRKAMYTYHRGGLDRMSTQIDGAVIACATAITQIAEAHKSYRNTMIVQMFGLTKQTEILQIFSNADSTQKERVYKAMIQIDAANAGKYRMIRG